MYIVLLHSASYIEIILNDKSAAAEEVILAFQLAENDSVSDLLAYQTYHFSLYIVKLLFVEFEVMQNYPLCKMADSKVVDENLSSAFEEIHRRFFFIKKQRRNENEER